MVAITVMIVPVAVTMPAVFVDVPPLPVFPPATLALFVQAVAPAVCLWAVESVMLDGLMEFVVRLLKPPPATVVISCSCQRRA